MNGLIRMLLNRVPLNILTGLALQCLWAALLLRLAQVRPDSLTGPFVWSAIAGILVWLHLLVTNGLKQSHFQFGDGATPMLKWQRRYQRVLLPVMELGVGALLLQGLLAALTTEPSAGEVLTRDHLMRIVLYAVAALLLSGFAAYLSALMRSPAWHLLKIGRNYTHLMTVMATGLLAAACGAHFGVRVVSVAAGWGLTGIHGFLAAELFLSMGLRLFTPRRPDAPKRLAFDFYLLEALAQPRRMGQTFTAMLEGVLGFDVTQTTFGKAARSLILPAVLLTALLLLGLSSLVIVQPYEQAIVLTLGRLEAKPLDSGLHFKLPWPLAQARHYNVSRVRRIHVGSHRPDASGQSIYREGVPILWTNLHGLNVDEPLICASPQDREANHGANQKGKAAARRVPSVSLAAADIQVQYVIADLAAYVRASAMPEAFLQKVAEASSSRLIYRHDIDALFCEARLSLADRMHRAIQAACDRHRMGVKIVHAAITAVHPPVPVANAFEATVAAMQERETEIQYARQQAIRSRVEATGSTEVFTRLSVLADSAETGQMIDAAEHEGLLHECGGEVAEILAEAEAYRFRRENVERGKTDRFHEQLKAHGAAPLNWRYDQYFSALGKGLSDRRKVVLMGDADKTIVRMGLGSEGDMHALSGAIDF